jgi:hypothetical protein
MDYWVAQQIVSAAAVGENKGAIAERERIIKLIRDRVAQAKEYGKTGRITAMQRNVTFEDLEAISEAIIYGIEKESK